MFLLTPRLSPPLFFFLRSNARFFFGGSFDRFWRCVVEALDTCFVELVCCVGSGGADQSRPSRSDDGVVRGVVGTTTCAVTECINQHQNNMSRDGTATSLLCLGDVVAQNRAGLSGDFVF